MTSKRANEQGFSGPFKDLLTEFAGLVERLSEEHGTSYVKAGDDKVYSLGGGGYYIVFDQNMWHGSVEVFTPTASLTIKQDESGKVVVNGGALDEKATKLAMRETIDRLAGYYENRYWQTP